MSTAAPVSPKVSTVAAKPVVEIDKKAQMLQKMEKQQEKKLDKVKENIKKYSHALVDTVEFDSTANKYHAQIKCINCGKEGRWVYTSDLHQVKHCEDCQTLDRKAKATEKRQQEKEAREHLKIAREAKNQPAKPGTAAKTPVGAKPPMGVTQKVAPKSTGGTHEQHVASGHKGGLISAAENSTDPARREEAAAQIPEADKEIEAAADHAAQGKGDEEPTASETSETTQTSHVVNEAENPNHEHHTAHSSHQAE